jgi:hypothetical protein
MQVAVNGNSPEAVEFVSPELRDEISEAFEMEGLMDQSAEARIIAAINKGNERLQAEQKATAIELRELGEEFRETKRDVLDLKEWKKTITDDKQATGRTAKDSVIRYTIGSLIAAVFTLLGIVGTIIFRPAPTPPTAVEAPQGQGNVTSQDMKELIKRIDQMVEARESEPAQVIKVPQRNKPRRPPGPPLGPGARNGEIWADHLLPLYGSARAPDLPVMERRF